MKTRTRDMLVGVFVSFGMHGLLVAISFIDANTLKDLGPKKDENAAAYVDLQSYEEPPPPKPEDQKEVADEEVQAEKSENSAASLPEPLSSMSIDSVSMDFKPQPPIAPKPNLSNFEIPSSTGRNKPTTTLSNFVDFDKLDKKPEARVQSPPSYPFEMKRQGIEGRVVLEFLVNSDGTVSDPFEKSSTHREFVKPAIDAVLKWKFKPGMKNGKAVSTRMQIPIGFKLDN